MNPSSLSWQPRWGARDRLAAAAVVAMTVLMAWSLLAGASTPSSARSDDIDKTDAGLYAAVIERMDQGDSYYQAVAAEHPSRGYPTSPVVVVREPTLAWLTSALGERAMVGLLWVLVVVAVGASVWVFDKTERSRTSWVVTAVVSSAAVGIFAFPGGVYVHEVWVSLLLYLGLLSRGTGRAAPAVVLVLAAALVRELVAPVLGVMLVLAWARGRRREALLWAGAVVVFTGFYLVHVVHVRDLVSQPGAASPGWLALGGFPFVVEAVRASSLLTLFPAWVASVLVPVGLLGWVARRGPLFDGVAAFLLVYTATFCVVGRPDNAYWGAFLAIFLLPGVVFGAGFLASLVPRPEHRPERFPGR